MKFRQHASSIAIVVILIASFVVRTSFEPVTRGDSAFYLAVSKNIVDASCYTVTAHPTAGCEPIYRGKPPGYSFFLAAIYWLLGQDLSYIVVIQSLLFAIAVGLVVFASPIRGPWRILLATGLAFSPLTLFWPRQIMSETLSATLTLCFTAALLYSIRRGQLSIVLISLLLGAAVLVRWEQVWLFVAVMVIAAMLYPPKQAAGVSGLVALLMLTPAALWGARAMAAGQPPWPDNPLVGPPGVIEFFKAAEVRQELVKYFLWPVINRQYSDIAKLPHNSIATGLDDPRLHPTIEELSRVPDGTELPQEIDQGLLSIARRFRNEQPVYSHVGVPLIRAGLLWSARDSQFNARWPDGWAWFMAPISQFYKIAIALASLLILCLAIVRQNKFLIYFAIAAIGATVARTVFLVNIPMLEMRYLVHGVPLVETLFFMAWPILWLATPEQQSGAANHSEAWCNS